MAAIREIGARMDLDYAGIDFSLTTDGKILVFEANPTMLVHPEKPNSPTADKNLYVDRILGAFEALLHRSAAAA
jgi:glutathione synthase/RimK-type ligase-like ATP-grasp enzyme